MLQDNKGVVFQGRFTDSMFRRHTCRPNYDGTRMGKHRVNTIQHTGTPHRTQSRGDSAAIRGAAANRTGAGQHHSCGYWTDRSSDIGCRIFQALRDRLSVTSQRANSSDSVDIPNVMQGEEHGKHQKLSADRTHNGNPWHHLCSST